MLSKDVDITDKLIDKFGTKYLKIGRYSVSAIYAIKQGWTKPEDFFNAPKNDMAGILRMYSGTLNHNFIEGLLPKDKCEIKKEYVYKDMVLVGKCDYLPNDEEVWDFKTSDTIMDKSKPWQVHQIRMYCTMFERATGSLFQPIIKDGRVVLKHLSTTKRDDEWFKKEVEELYEFHKLLLSMKAKKEAIPDPLDKESLNSLFDEVTKK